jgi:hypothetical protein
MLAIGYSYLSYIPPSLLNFIPPQLPNSTEGNQASQLNHPSIVSHCAIPDKASKLKSTTEFRVIPSSTYSSAARPSINVTEGNDKAIISVTSSSLQDRSTQPLPGPSPRSKRIKIRGSGRRPEPGSPPRLLGTPASQPKIYPRANESNTTI